MLNANLESHATIEASDFSHLITLALLALETSAHPIAKNSHLTAEQLQQLASLIHGNEYNDIAADKVQITVKHINTEAQRQAILHGLYINE